MPQSPGPTDSLRLLWITTHYPPARGGMAGSCDRIVAGLRKRGVVVDVAHLSTRHARVHLERQQGGELIRIPLGEDGPHAINRLWLRLEERRGQYSHVTAFGAELPLQAGPAFAAWLDAPLYVLLRGNDLDVGLFSTRARDVVDRALDAAAGVGVVTRTHFEKLARLKPGLPLRYLPNGIDVDGFGALPHDRRAAERYRAEHVGADRVVIGLVGHLKAKKGALLCLEAMAQSRQAGRLHVRLVGELDPDVAAFVDALDQTAPGALTVTVEPFRDRLELLEVYASLDWVALPSLYDGMPNVLLEAMASAIPILATRVGGMADVVVDGHSGFLFAPDDSAAMREGVLRLLGTSEEQRQAMGQAAVRRVRDGHTDVDEINRYLAWFSPSPGASRASPGGPPVAPASPEIP